MDLYAYTLKFTILSRVAASMGNATEVGGAFGKFVSVLVF